MTDGLKNYRRGVFLTKFLNSFGGDDFRKSHIEEIHRYFTSIKAKRAIKKAQEEENYDGA